MGGVGIRHVVICCCGIEMYFSVWRLAPRISYTYVYIYSFLLFVFPENQV